DGGGRGRHAPPAALPVTMSRGQVVLRLARLEARRVAKLARSDVLELLSDLPEQLPRPPVVSPDRNLRQGEAIEAVPLLYEHTAEERRVLVPMDEVVVPPRIGPVHERLQRVARAESVSTLRHAGGERQ